MNTLCECGCGQPTKIARWTNVKTGAVKSEPLRFLHGHHSRVHPGCFQGRFNEGRKDALRHGMTNTHEYVAYTNARTRCFNPNSDDWEDYGGRGIQFLFKTFEEFFAELGPKPSPKHSLDRINTNGHYEPGNVKWSTASEQVNNRRPFKKRAA